MAKKTDLEVTYKQWGERYLIVLQRNRIKDVGGALDAALDCIPHMHDAITFQRRYLNVNRPAFEPIEYILNFAPYLFRFENIDRVEKEYLSGTKTERQSLSDLPQMIDASRRKMEQSERVWFRLSEAPDRAVEVDTANPLENSLVKFWEVAGLIYEIGPRFYAKITDMRRMATGKCVKCGMQRFAEITEILDVLTCKNCALRTGSVLISRRV